MKTVIAAIIASTLIFGIFGAATWNPETANMAGFDIVTTTAMSAVFGALFGAILAVITWGIRKIID